MRKENYEKTSDTEMNKFVNKREASRFKVEISICIILFQHFSIRSR